MWNNWDEILEKLQSIKSLYDKAYKCLNKTKLPSSHTINKHLAALIVHHNETADIVTKVYSSLTDPHQHEIKTFSEAIKTRLEYLLERLNIEISIPNSIFAKIDYKVTCDINLPSSESDSETESTTMALTAAEFIKLASSILPDFNGEIETLQKFLTALDLVNTLKETHEVIAVQLIKTKLIQKAQKLIKNENTINAIKDTLIRKVKGESSAVATTKLLSTMQNNKKGDEYIKEIESLANKLENAYITDGVDSELAQKLATQSAVAAITKGARAERIKTIMLAGQFNTISEVTTKFVAANTRVDLIFLKSSYQITPPRKVFYPMLKESVENVRQIGQWDNVP